jgi:hypothetical protein
MNSVFGGLAKQSSAAFWTGTGFTGSAKSATAWSPNNPTPVGAGLFITSKNAYTNTYVGEVIVGPGGSTTNALPAGATVLVGSALPYAGTLNSTNIGLLTLAKQSSASFWTGSGYIGSAKSATAWSPDIAINVADGFFINSKTATNWVQTLPAN